MRPDVANQLVELNQRFYQTFASAFSQTRQRLQPGVLRVLEGIPPEARVLDLGCGNGELARQLAVRGHTGGYTGLDFSAGLLAEAQNGLPEEFEASFQQADLSGETWDQGLPPVGFDYVLCFATLHHLPGEALRLRFLRKVRALLAPGGRFVFSNWQFLNSQRLRERLQPWQHAGLNEADVDPGDYLLDWRRGGEGLRYVHHFSPDELAELAAASGFELLDSFTSDGEGGRLGLYGVWGVG